jgi:hypothetical protein
MIANSSGLSYSSRGCASEFCPQDTQKKFALCCVFSGQKFSPLFDGFIGFLPKAKLTDDEERARDGRIRTGG